MTIDQLTAVGHALYGPRWQTDVAHLLDVDSRRIRAWVQGERSIPPGIRGELVDELRRRGSAAIDLADDLGCGAEPKSPP